MIRIITSLYEMEDIIKLKEAGATSIIIGTPFYSVRSTSHFSMEELHRIRELTYEKGLEMFVLVNRICFEDELMDLRKHLVCLKELNVDGIYFNDMGVFYEAQQLGMQGLMIYNPDTILTNAADISAYLQLGMKMATISKEITLENMIMIGNKIKDKLEVIVHGRLNMMHSKRNLLTNYMSFIKSDMNLKNCHDLYLMEETREEHMPIMEDAHGTHMYTGFTLCSFEEMEDLLTANIRNFRIESHFMKIEELCEVVKDYCQVIQEPMKGREMYHFYEKTYCTQNITKGFLYKKTGLLK